MSRESFQSELLGTRECVVDPSRCVRDGRILSGIVGYGPQLIYAGLATRATAYLPGKRSAVSGVQAISSQYALHVQPQHHPTWAGVLDGIGYGLFVVQIKDGFSVGKADVVNLEHMEHVQKIGCGFCRGLKAKEISFPPNVQSVGCGFLFRATIQSALDLSGMHLLKKCGNCFCAGLDAPALILPLNIEEAGSNFLADAHILDSRQFDSMPRVKTGDVSFCDMLKPIWTSTPLTEEREEVFASLGMHFSILTFILGSSFGGQVGGVGFPWVVGRPGTSKSRCLTLVPPHAFLRPLQRPLSCRINLSDRASIQQAPMSDRASIQQAPKSKGKSKAQMGKSKVQMRGQVCFRPWRR